MDHCKQDMPPPSGYAPIVYRYIPLKTGLDPKLKLLALLTCSGLGFAWFKKARWEITKDRLEEWSANAALMPMIVAETDRMLLKQLKRNRDAEEQVMKDVEGWEVGKWKNLSVYSSFKPDEYFKPTALEYFMHDDVAELLKYKNVFQYN